MKTVAFLIYFILETWVWVDGTYTPEGVFALTTGEDPVFNNWNGGQPPATVETICLEIVAGDTNYPTAGWVVAGCDHNHLYMCEKDHA